MNKILTKLFKGRGSGRNERAVEVAFGVRYIEEVSGKGDLIEVGGVMPGYVKCDHTVIDPRGGKGVVKAFAQDCDFTDKHVLSISTIEHIGKRKLSRPNWRPYGFDQPESLGFEILNRIYERSKSCLISWPIGYNEYLDKKTKDNLNKFD